MTIKIGHTDGSVFSVYLQQLLVEPLWGNKLVASPPHPDAPGGQAITLSSVGVKEHVTIDPVVKDALNIMSHLASAVGRGQALSIEKLPYADDEEAKFTITIKKK